MAAPAATAFANASSGSSLINTILTVPPPSVSGLKFLCSGDSSATQNSAPSIERRATTAPSGASTIHNVSSKGGFVEFHCLRSSPDREHRGYRSVYHYI